jgi:tRNA(Ile)-lysidine synthetase-like protein
MINIDAVKSAYMLLDKYLHTHSPVVMAISGWPDSMLCASLLREWWIKNQWHIQDIKLIYCDHQLRNTQEDIAVIRNYFPDLSLDIIEKKGGGIKEKDLRDRRHKAIGSYTKKYLAQAVVLWHNLTDRIESTFLNMLRGADVHGILGMREYVDNHLGIGYAVVRPLLHLAKGYIQQLCNDYDIPYMIDPTNVDDSVSLRNKLRNRILQPLYAMAHNPSLADNTLLYSMEKLYEYLDTTTNTFIPYLLPMRLHPSRCAERGWQREIERNCITKHTLMAVLRKLWLIAGVSEARINDLENFLSDKSSGYKYMLGAYFWISHDKIYIIKAPRSFWKQRLTLIQDITHLGNISFAGQELEIDDQKRLGAQLGYAQGEMKYGSKSRTKWCINHKIPLFWRQCIPLVLYEGKIIHAFVPSNFSYHTHTTDESH